MSRYPVNPRTGLREPPARETIVVLFEVVATLMLGFVGITVIAGLLYICLGLWTLMLT